MVQKFALVTGACGFIGSHMVDYLLSQGYKVRATDLSYAPRTYLNPEAEFRPCDLTEKDTVPDLLEDIDVVFHFAAIFNFSAALDIAYKVNVEGTRNLLEACRAKLPEGHKGIRLSAKARGAGSRPPDIRRIVVASTGAFYDARGHSDVEFSENGSVRPKNNYETTKFEQERLSLRYTEDYNLPVVVARLAGVYGARSLYGVGSVISYIARGQLSFIPGKGDRPAATCHVLDVVRACEFLSRAPKETIGEIYNVADDTTDSIASLIRHTSGLIPDTKIYGHVPVFAIKFIVHYSEWMSKRTGKPPKIERGIIDYILHPFRMANQKIKNLGFEFQHSKMENQLEEVIDWYGPIFRQGENNALRVLELTERSRKNAYETQQTNYGLETLLQRRRNG